MVQSLFPRRVLIRTRDDRVFSIPTGERSSTHRATSRNQSGKEVNTRASSRDRLRAESDRGSPTSGSLDCVSENESKERKPSAQRPRANRDDPSLPSVLHRVKEFGLC